MRLPPLRPLLAFLCVSLVASLAGAAPPREQSGADDGGEPRLLARLRVDPRGADHWRVGVELVPETGWHVYWRNPGDTGLAPKIDWRLPGADFGELRWPAARAFVDAEADLISYGYDAPVLLATDARVGPDARRLEARVEALVCADRCIPADFELGVALDPDSSRVAGDRARFDASEGVLPQPAGTRGVELALVAGAGGEGERRATLEVFPCGRRADACSLESSAEGGPGLLPFASAALNWRASAPHPHPEVAGAFTVELVAHSIGDETPEGERLTGVVPLRDAAGRERPVEVSLVAEARAPARAGGMAFVNALLLGWLGGLILNLMPCVLPVLALKLASLAELARSSRREQRRHVAAYTAGIALSMLALAAAVLTLRAAGSAVGWGFQLQEPGFLLAIGSLLVAFALNLFGVFEIHADTGRLAGVGSDAPGAGRSFFDGLLAVALATPCSAPFLGTAVGFAFASPAPVIVTVFLAIGLGLATPFGLAAFFPAWARKLPRSGAWMSDLRGLLAFALLASVLWLLWILGRLRGSEAILTALALWLVVATAAWTLGLLQRHGRNVSASVCAVVLGGIAALGVVFADPGSAEPDRSGRPVIESARPFAVGSVRSSLDDGRPVFVYFTADWCVTCKVNERGVLADPGVGRELERLGYDVYRADWTRRDENIRAALAELGKAGVPVYALYDPRAPHAPIVLPELLTRQRLLTALQQAAGDAPRS